MDTNDIDALTPEEAAHIDGGADLPPEPEKEPVKEVSAEETAPVEEKPKFVPHQAMHEERKRRQAAEAKVAEYEARLKALETPKAPEPEYADPVVNPDAHRKWLEHQLAKQGKQVQEITQAQQTERQRAEIINFAASAEQEFKAQTPDYDDALTFARQAYVRELESLFELRGMDPQSPEVVAEIKQQLAMGEVGLIAQAKQMGVNPAALVYRMAKARGWTPKQAQAAQQIAARAEAQKNAATIGAVPGGSPGEVTATSIASMSEAEIDALLKKNPDALRKALGG